MGHLVSAVNQAWLEERNATPRQRANAIGGAIAGSLNVNGSALAHQQVHVDGVTYAVVLVRDAQNTPGTERRALLIDGNVLADAPCFGSFDAPRELLQPATSNQVNAFLAAYRQVARAFDQRIAEYEGMGGLPG
jgi:hypothetical protein